MKILSWSVMRLNAWASDPWRSLAKPDNQVLASVCLRDMAESMSLAFALLLLSVEIRTVRSK